jgi:predicted MFS family arabinose efflux permease
MAALIGLALTGFLCIMTETMPAGLLPQMAKDLHISLSLAGQTVTAYAAGSVIAAIPLTIATQRWPRRRVLLLTLCGFLACNGATAYLEKIPLVMLARFGAGAAAGLAWSLLAGYARRMVPARQQGRALAVAMAGTPVALSIGVPLGTWVGSLLGWRLTFAAMSGITILLLGWVRMRVPDYPGIAVGNALPLDRVWRTPGVRAVLGVVVTWMLAHNLLYTYVAPIVAPAGLGAQVDTILLVFGIASLVSIGAIGKIVDRHLRSATLVSLIGFVIAIALFGVAPTRPSLVYLGVALWGLAFGGAGTLLQTALADAAGDGADVALSLNVVVWNLAIAGGGLLGGVLLDGTGTSALVIAAGALALCAVIATTLSRRHGFRVSRH